MIRKNTNGTYTVRVGQHGIQRTFTRKRDADEYEAHEKENRRREAAGLQVRRGPITFGELAELWKQSHEPSLWRLRMLAHAEERWSSTKVKSIHPEELGAWLHALELAPKTKKHILETLRQVLKAAVEWGYLERSPARPGTFKPPSESRIRPIRPFESWSEVIAVSNALPAIYNPLVRFVCATGLTSPSEWIDARWADVNLRERELMVHGTKTENRQRTIPLSDRALEALADLPRDPAGWLFRGKTGKRIDYGGFRRIDWPLALRKAGLEFRTPNEMRHTFATLALQAGAHLEDVSKVLGHANVDITRRYYAKWTKPRYDRFREVLDTIGETG